MLFPSLGGYMLKNTKTPPHRLFLREL